MDFNRQYHRMSPQMTVALNKLLSYCEDAPDWLIDIVKKTQVNAHFYLCKEQVIWVNVTIQQSGRHSQELNPDMYFLQSQCDPKNYFYLNSGICNPSY